MRLLIRSRKRYSTGEGGFARDYMVKLNKGDNLAIDLTSDSFDSIVTLLAADGSQKMMTAQMGAFSAIYPHHKGRDIFHSRSGFW